MDPFSDCKQNEINKKRKRPEYRNLTLLGNNVTEESSKNFSKESDWP